MKFCAITLFIATLLFTYSTCTPLRSLKQDDQDSDLVLDTDPGIKEALRTTPDISGQDVLTILRSLISFYLQQGLYTVNPTAISTFKLLKELEVQYRLNHNPLASGMRQIDALAEVFVIAINGYPDTDQGVQTIALKIAAKANSEFDDDEVAKAYVAAVAINFGCNQAVVAYNVAFADVSAEAMLDINLECEFGGPDAEHPISPHYCLRREKSFCCRAQMTRRCRNDGMSYDEESNQLYQDGELYCNCN